MRHLPLLAVIFLTAANPVIAQEKSTPVILGKIEISSVGQKIIGTGRIEPLESVAIAPQLAGKLVRKVLVKEGDWVNAGDVVTELDDAEAVKALAKARTAHASAKASHENANVAFKRGRMLTQQGAASAEQFDALNMTLNTSAAALEQAAIDVETAKQELEKHRVVSERAGLILTVGIKEGELSATGNTIVLAVDGELVVKVEIPETKIRSLVPGTPADVIPLDGAVEPGAVKKIDTKINTESRLGTVKVGLKEDTTLISGMFARVLLEGVRQSRVSIPVKAITFLNAKPVVFQVNKENRLTARSISIIGIEGDTAFVSGDMSESDFVVTSGPGLLNEGNLVHVITGEAVTK